MSSAWRRLAGRAALALLAVPAGAAALEFDAGYLQAGYASGLSRPADGGPRETGAAAAIRLPITQRWFIAGTAQQLEPYVDTFGGRHEEEVRLALGLGVRRVARGRELYGQLTYVDFKNWRNDDDPPRARGGTLSIGARNPLGEHTELVLEGGMGYAEGGTAHLALVGGRAGIATEIVPSLWAYVEAANWFLDSTTAQAGLRYSFAGPKPAPRPPAVKPAEQGEPAVLAVGASVVAQRPLQLQVRPAFGAPETILVPAGATLSLLETAENKFGSWWRVRYGEQEGWIREGHLK